MTIELPPLPFGRKSLEPYISEETINFHYGKHHQGYVNKVNNLVAGTDFEGKSLEMVIAAASGSLLNFAAQAWNHTFYWNSLNPKGGGDPSGLFAESLIASFGSIENFREAFTRAAVSNFGSGWTWLVRNADGSLSVINTSNAGTPLGSDQKPLLTCDVWEHAYYIDYRNARPEYLKGFWNLVNWEFGAKNFAQ